MTTAQPSNATRDRFIREAASLAASTAFQAVARPDQPMTDAACAAVADNCVRVATAIWHKVHPHSALPAPAPQPPPPAPVPAPAPPATS